MLFSLKTTNIPKFKALIDALKEIMIETNLQFSEKGIDIFKINSQGSVLCTVHLNFDMLNNEKINHYNCDFPKEKPFVVGVNLLTLAKILRSIPQKSTLKLEVDQNNNNKLKIIILTEPQLVNTTYELNFIEIDQETLAKLNLPEYIEVDYDSVIEIDSKYLQKQIKDINQMGVKVIEVKAMDTELVLTGHHGFIKRETTIYEPKSCNNNSEIMKILSKSDQMYQGKFATKDLLSICKFMYLSNEYTIKLKNDFPMVLEVIIENLGQATLIITSMDSNTEKEI